MLLTLLVWLLLAGLAALWYSGAFSAVHVRVGAAALQGSLSVRYQCGRGSYWTMGRVLRELRSLLPTNACLIALCYDDPKTTPAAECRWAVGAVCRATNRKPLPDGFVQQLAGLGYLAVELPAIEQAVLTEHPFTTPLSGYIAPWKAYPAIASHIQRERLSAYPAVELYEQGRVQYCLPLQHNQHYYLGQHQTE